MPASFSGAVRMPLSGCRVGICHRFIQTIGRRSNRWYYYYHESKSHRTVERHVMNQTRSQIIKHEVIQTE